MPIKFIIPFACDEVWNGHMTQFSELRHEGGEGNGSPLQCSCLENPMDGGAWYFAVHGVTKSQTRLSDFTLTFHFHAVEKEMATHSSVLAWRIPGTGEPGGLPSLGSHRVIHDWNDLAATAAARHEGTSAREFVRSVLFSLKKKKRIQEEKVSFFLWMLWYLMLWLELLHSYCL